MPDRDELRLRRRTEILDAALVLVAEEGLEALTIGALEARLEFTRGVITYHFRNKAEIVLGVLERAIDEIDERAMAAILSEDEAEPRARAVVREMVGSWLGHPAAGPVLLSFWGLVRTNPRAAELNAAMFSRYRRYSEALVRTGIERGEVRADAEPTSMAAVMVALVVGIATQAMFEPEAIDVAAVVQEAGDVVVRHLRA